MPEQALSDVKVLDLTHHIAGPYCTKMLADLGAEVIKVERPDGGDPARRAGPFPNDEPHLEKSGLFLHLNTNKKSITLNLKTESGKRIIRDLAKRADILVENFRPSMLPSLGLGYDALSEINPRLIVTSISNFGQTGPYRDYEAEDIVVMALSGLMSMTGEEGREPLKFGGSQGQYQGGVNGFVATMCALLFQSRTDEGQHVDISIMRSLNSILESYDMNYSYNKQTYSRRGTKLPGGNAAWGIYPSADGFVGIISGPVRRYLQMAELMEAPDLTQDKYIRDRVTYADEMDAMMMPWLLSHNKEEIYHAGQARGIPFAIVASTEDLLTSTQLEARNFWAEIDHPEAGTLKYPGAPGKMLETPWQAGRAPLLGEHNEEVYGQLLGYSKEDLVMFRERGVI